MDLWLSTRSVPDHAVLEVRGEVDVFSAPKLRDELKELVTDGERRVVVDLGGVEFLDSTGLGVLVGAHKRLRACDGALRIVCPHERLLKIFRITALDTILEIYSSVEAAADLEPGRAGPEAA